ncbi:MAG: hypothetical protein ABIR66_07735 [Saprospiraceae bacterium]
MKFLNCWFIFSAFIHSREAAAQKNPKPRAIIATDGERDDVDSSIRMLLYSNEIRI